MQDLMTIERRFEHEVTALDTSNPQQPRFIVQKVGTEDVRTEIFDFVHLANGTPLTPVLTVNDLSMLTDIPNHDSVKNFLSVNNIIAEGQIRPNSRIQVVGFSLSAYDYIPLILRHTPLLEPTQSGYTINEGKAKDYQGLLTFVSRSGVPIAPRIISKFNPNRTPIVTTEEVHVLLMQKDFD